MKQPVYYRQTLNPYDDVDGSTYVNSSSVTGSSSSSGNGSGSSTISDTKTIVADDISTTSSIAYVYKTSVVILHWNIYKPDNGNNIIIDFNEDESHLVDGTKLKDIEYNDGTLFTPKIKYLTNSNNYDSKLIIRECVIVGNDSLTTVNKFIINSDKTNGGNEWFSYKVDILADKFESNNNKYVLQKPIELTNIVSSPLPLADINIVNDFSIIDVVDGIDEFDGDLCITASLIYYILKNDDSVSDSDDEDETLPSISGNFFSPGEVVYYIEGNYIKKIVVYEIELTWEKPADVDIMEQTSLTDIHGRRGIGEKKYIDDYKLFKDKDNLINHVTNNEERKEPEKKYFYVKYRLGDSVYSLWNGSVRYAKITKVTYTESKSLVDYTTNIDIKYTLQEGEDEWIVSEDNVFADISDIKTTISDELSVEDYSNNLIYLGCDVCDVKK
jgi:hypothetical protein